MRSSNRSLAAPCRAGRPARRAAPGAGAPLGALLALLALAPGAASAQSTPAPQAESPPAAAQSLTPPPPEAKAKPDLATAEGRAARLDELFAQLRKAEAGYAPKLEEEIQRIWARSGSDSMDLLLLRGRQALEHEEVVKAIHHFTALTDHDPGFAEGWNMRATAFFMHGDLGMALADIERTLALEPRHYGALSGLGVILQQLDRPKEALAAFREAQAINPNLENVQEAIEQLAHEVDGRDI